MNRLAIRKGDEIVCEGGHTIGISLVDIMIDDIINAEDVDWKQKKYKNGDKAYHCKKCRKSWYSVDENGKISLLLRKNLWKLKNEKERIN